MTSQKPGRNDPCWCGSGYKFKKCHLGRDDAPRVPFKAIKNEVERTWNEKRCLHPLASAQMCDRIVSAHTMQRSRVLERLVDVSNHLWTFYQELGDKPRHVGWREASTFPGFCGRHDDSTFRALEKAPFTGTTEQCFLIGYRALCHEVHQKRASIRTSSLIRDLGDRGYPEAVQRDLQSSYAAIDAGARKGLAAFEALKGSMDQQLLSADYSAWSRLVVRFAGQLCVASTGVVSPDRDLDGRQLQVLHDPDPRKQETLLYGVDATNDGGAVVLVWPSHQRAPARFVASLVARGPEVLPGLLVQFMFAFVENTYFSGHWWESLGEKQKGKIVELAHLENAYYAPFAYGEGSFVPWQTVDVQLDDAA